MNIRQIKNIFIKNKKIISIYNKMINRKKRVYKKNHSLFINKRGLEIGGPSNVFKDNNAFPIYTIVNNIDNVNFSEKTYWSSLKDGNSFTYNKTSSAGVQIISDTTNLERINSETYDFLLASHVIEHIANPIKAVKEWIRVLKPNGFLVIIAPNKEKTYDIHRPITVFTHILDDYNNNIQEDDKTHFTEVLKLHDITNDGTVFSLEEHKKRVLNNFHTRTLHHHVFDLKLLCELMTYCNCKIVDSEIFKPYHILIIAQVLEKTFHEDN